MNKTTDDERLGFDRHSEAERESIKHRVQGKGDAQPTTQPGEIDRPR